MSERSYRIRTDVTKDKVVRVKIEQDYDFLEILSLKIKQEDTYKLHVANYGVIVGRVLANDSFGIPNAKVSVFIALDDIDKANSEITNIYPYTSFQTKDSDGRRYNLLPDESNDDCYRVVGTFPNKRLVLDDDTQLEIFDKYWKYTTVTNKSGDYMIFGVPTGGQQIHVDIDLSDIGVLSQKPIDFIYKGYNSTQFDNAQQFKESNNLDNLSQLLSQNQSVHVYPFWGDSNLEEIAISRCDIQVQYKFEPTCVFFGAIMTDNYNNNIGHKCSASKYAGFNRHLVTGEGTIEMIRKTPDNLVEEFQIQGNRLIDGDGVWCYQIPMNLDFVGTDEFGNIVPTDDPNKGIPTRTCVRFRVSMQETGNEGVSRHRAKYLIPNVQDLVPFDKNDVASKPFIESGKKFEQCYEFGSATPDEYYRDLYWNKVYSVKNYIPRIQTNPKKNTQNYSAIRTVNSNNDVNPVPYNHARFRLAFAYRVLCMIMTIVFAIICGINALISGIAGIKILGIRPFKWVCSLVGCIGVEGGLTEDEDSNIEYYPCCSYKKCMSCKVRGCTQETSYDALINVVQQALSQEYDTVNLDFYNDWLNGSLYMPLWFWKKTKKKKFLFGLFSKKAVNSYCACNKNFPKLRVTQGCSLPYTQTDYSYNSGDKGKYYHDNYPQEKTFTVFGVIKEFVNKAGLNIYYYAPGIPNDPKYKELDEKTSYVRLYSTDIILLGSLNSCDLDNYPNVFTNLPTTTASVPFIATIKQALTEEEGATYMEGTEEEEGLIEVTGMDWLHKPQNHKPKYGAGLFMDLACNAVYTKPKTCANIERLCELGVTYDTHTEEPIAKNGTINTMTILADGLITRYELVDNETRAMFASLNNNGLTKKIFNPNTGYFTYKLRYVYPTDFDGHMNQYSSGYTSMMDIPTYDNYDDSYVEFRFGPTYTSETKQDINTLLKFFYSHETEVGQNKWSFPIFNNSFYFYFGIHEGSTAIDKFNSIFYATCYKNIKYPFTMTIDTEPAKWCPESLGSNKDKGYATIKIKFNGIKKPYNYVLYNEFNEEILSEDGVYIDELNFGYKIISGGGDYEYSEVVNPNGTTTKELIKNGVFTEFLTCEPILDSNGNPMYVENGTYIIEITDINGNKARQNIIIEQIPIGLVYETIELGDKYYDKGLSVESDFCNENKLFGELRISAVTIDGHDYKITGVDGGNGEYNLTLINDKGENECAFLQIDPQPELDENGNEVDYSFTECTCHGVGGFGEIIPEDWGILFPIWRPSTFTMTITQRCPCDGELNDITQRCPCDGELNDNSSTLMAVVKNGKPFNAYINEMPLKFILGKNEQYNYYNPNFYKVGASMPSQLPGWFGLHDENSYCFTATTTLNENIWGDFISITTEQNPEGNDQKFYLTDESIYNILIFKFEKMFNLAKTCYACSDQDIKMEIKHTGGKSPILYRGHYPVYSEITGEETPDNRLKIKRFNSEGSVVGLTNYTNIVGGNYTYLDPTSGLPVNMFDDYQEPYFNKIYSYEQNIGNYYAVFTRNGGLASKLNESGDEECYVDETVKYQQIPFKSTPTPIPSSQCDSIFCTDAECEWEGDFNSVVYRGNNSFKPYFRGEFVDRRLDYDLIIFTPYAGDDVPIISSEDTDETKPKIWKKGRFSGNTYNGIEMVYNNTKEYQIIGKGLEYEYAAKDGANTDMILTGYTDFQDFDVKTIYNTDIVYKRYYKTILKCNSQKVDINDFYWAYDKNKIRNPNNFGVNVIEIGGEVSDINVFSYNHVTDKERFYNGDFNVKNYPIRRLLDVGNIPSCEKLTFTCSSCSYDIDVDIMDIDETTYVTGSTDECGETEFMIDCRNMIVPENSSLEECAANLSHNILFLPKGRIMNCDELKLKCKIKADSYNTTHSIYSEFPRLVKIKGKGVDENFMKIIKHTTTDLNDIISKFNSYTIREFGYDKSSVKDLKKVRERVNVGSLKKYKFGHFWVDNNDHNRIAYDDNVNVKNVMYDGSCGLGDVDVLGVLLKRNYINDSGDNLTKYISTFQMASIYDVRKFEFDLYCKSIVEVKNTDVEGTPDVDVNVNVTVPGEGNTSSSASGNGSGNANISPENTTATTKVQQTIYRITTYKNNIDYNQQFYEIDENGKIRTDSLSAIFAIHDKFTTSVSIYPEEDGNKIYIYFKVLWTGDLSKYTFDKLPGLKVNALRMRLYISMPNNLIYTLRFYKDDFTTNEECPEDEDGMNSTNTPSTTP